MKKKIVAIVGPTAVGKTSLSIQIAKKFNGEIISGDSMQVYKGLDIGTDKIMPDERHGIAHFMIDIKEPYENYSVAEFQQDAKKHIEEITERNKLPILVGGSGLYVQAILYNYQFPQEQQSKDIREQLEKILNEKGSKELYNCLQRIDPLYAKNVHPNNHRRVIRALEIYETTGKTMTEHRQNQPKESPYDPIIIGLQMERKVLYERIHQRIDQMLENGLVEEVRSLYQKGLKNSQSMSGIGYKEFIPYFEGHQSFEETIEILKRNTRRFAKRQETWFKNQLTFHVHWYPLTPDTVDQIFHKILSDLEGLL